MYVSSLPRETQESRHFVRPRPEEIEVRKVSLPAGCIVGKFGVRYNHNGGDAIREGRVIRAARELSRESLKGSLVRASFINELHDAVQDLENDKAPPDFGLPGSILPIPAPPTYEYASVKVDKLDKLDELNGWCTQ